MREKWEVKERAYAFLKTAKPEIERLDDKQNERVEILARSSRISKDTAKAVIVVGDIEELNFPKIKRLKNPTAQQKLQTLLGVSVTIPKEIIKLYGEESARLGSETISL